MPEYTNFPQAKPCNAKDVPSGNTQHSPDVKAGFLDVPGRPPGVQGRDFLSEQPPLPPEKPSLRPRQLSIAVRSREMEFGVVYSCVEDKMYTGRKGKGAFCNGQRLQVSQQEDITKSLLVTELGSSRKPETLRTVLSNMEKLCSIPIHGIRSVGTAAVNMCLVATGGADAYYEMGIHCWDMAGAGIIVTEAGGVLMDVTGGPFDLMSRRIIAANNKTLAERIAKEIEIIPLQRDDES
ncbi:Inositol monophosphatase [Cricetulus griseus]|uniref:Inositol-1-monophosphatase n=1 Tax=Cricetulus griseus TaxID=10029 RepID=G3I4E6_CRIGR|nr:Inositol monophosphatase [Cricetulus griseus]